MLNFLACLLNQLVIILAGLWMSTDFISVPFFTFAHSNFSFLWINLVFQEVTQMLIILNLLSTFYEGLNFILLIPINIEGCLNNISLILLSLTLSIKLVIEIQSSSGFEFKQLVWKEDQMSNSHINTNCLSFTNVKNRFSQFWNYLNNLVLCTSNNLSDLWKVNLYNLLFGWNIINLS